MPVWKSLDRCQAPYFTASRVERLHETVSLARGIERQATTLDWVTAFKDERTQIVEHRCPQ